MADEGDPGGSTAVPEVATAKVSESRYYGRRILTAVLVVLSCVLLVFSVLAVWVRSTITNTDRYVETVAPLVSNEQVSRALSLALVDKIYTTVDVPKLIENVTPGNTPFLAEAIARAARSYLEDAAQNVLQSDRATTLWEDVNRRAHPLVLRWIRHDGQEIQLQLGPTIESALKTLGDRGIHLFPNDTLPEGAGTITVVGSNQQSTLNSMLGIVDRLGWILPVAWLIVTAGAIVAARDRLRTLLNIAVGSVLGMAVLAVIIRVSKTLVLDQFKVPVNQAAASSAWDIILRYLYNGMKVVAVVALIVAVVAWLFGSSKLAVAQRRQVRMRLQARREGMDPSKASPLGLFLGTHQRGIEGGLIGVALVVALLASRITVGLLVVIVVATVVAVVAVEVLAVPPDPEATDTGPPEAPPAEVAPEDVTPQPQT